jgi:putative redox protein
MTEPVTLHSHGSFRNEVEAGPHRFIIDEPASAGGGGEGPTPYDLLAAAIGGCTSMTLHYYAKREKLPLESIDITVVHDREHAEDCAECMAKAGYIHRFRIEIQLGGPLTEEQRQHLLTIAARCPVAKTLASEIRVDDVLVGSQGERTSSSAPDGPM